MEVQKSNNPYNNELKNIYTNYEYNRSQYSNDDNNETSNDNYGLIVSSDPISYEYSEEYNHNYPTEHLNENKNLVHSNSLKSLSHHNSNNNIVSYNMNVVNLLKETALFSDSNQTDIKKSNSIPGLNTKKYKNIDSKKLEETNRRRNSLKNSSGKNLQYIGTQRTLSIKNINNKTFNKENYKTFKSSNKNIVDESIHSSRNFVNRNYSSSEYRRKMIYGSGVGGINKTSPKNESDDNLNWLYNNSLTSRSLSLTKIKNQNNNFSLKQGLNSIYSSYDSSMNYKYNDQSHYSINANLNKSFNNVYNRQTTDNKKLKKKLKSNNNSNSNNDINKNDNRSKSANSINKMNKNLNDMNSSLHMSDLTLNDNSNNNNITTNKSNSKNDLDDINTKTKNQLINESFFISSQKELPSINNDKINEKKEEDISLPPIKGLILQQKVVKPVYKAKNLKVGSINHKNARAKVDDKNNFSKSRKNEAKIKENIKEVQVMSSINPEKSTTKKEEIEHKESNDIQNKKSSVSIEDEIVIETEEQKEEMKIVNAYINKLDDIKVDEEYHLQTETHHEIKRDRNFLNGNNNNNYNNNCNH
ncbi:hypothetical protein H8356DRAFT_918989 [Neocallimastix lanati (nom. inval.)]|nr:hypothetical protein H8356DRAFT_918989 [Neocallimastix sp. JGI-2020a]